MQRATQPARGEDRIVVVGSLATRELAKARIPDIRVDDRDGGAGEITESQAEVDDHGRHGDLVVARHEADDPDAIVVNAMRDARAGRLDLADASSVEPHADRREDGVVFADRSGGRFVWHR